MKIAIVCPYDFFRPGGVQVHIHDLSMELRKQGHHITIIAPDVPRLENSKDQDVAFFGKSKSIVFNETQIDVSLAWGKEYVRLKEWLAQQQFDVIHFHTIWDPFLSFQILALAGKSARVATFHDTPPDTFSGRLTRKFFTLLSRFLYQWLDCITAVSQSPAGHLYRKSGHPIHICPPSIDYSRFLRIDRNNQDNELFTIVFVGRLDPRKGVFILLQAYENLKQRGEKIRLVVAGNGEQFDILQQTIKDKNIQDVTLLGYISEEDKYHWLSKADVFCSPALFGESFGIVLVEAMAAGVPVVGAANSGYSTVLKNQSKYCLSIPCDPIDLAEKLKALVNDANCRQDLSEWGRKEAVQHDIKAWAPKWGELYRQAIEQRQKTNRH